MTGRRAILLVFVVAAAAVLFGGTAATLQQSFNASYEWNNAWGYAGGSADALTAGGAV